MKNASNDQETNQGRGWEDRRLQEKLKHERWAKVDAMSIVKLLKVCIPTLQTNPGTKMIRAVTRRCGIPVAHSGVN